MATCVLSVVIPVFNDADSLKSLLLTLGLWRQKVAAQCEFVVVDGGSDDGSIVIAQALADKVVCSSLGRGRQMNAGAEAASGQFLWFLHADSVCGSELLNTFYQQLLTRPLTEPTWGFFSLNFHESLLALHSWRYRLLAKLIFIRAKVTGIATGDLGIWLTRTLFFQMAGYPDQPLMEDIELSKKLSKARQLNGHDVQRVIQPHCLLTSARKWQQQGFFRTIIAMWWCRFKYFWGVDADQLALSYYPELSARFNSDSTCEQLSAANVCLLVFSKRIKAGAVKTRMQPFLNSQQSAQLHRLLVADTIDRLKDLGYPIQFWLTGLGEFLPHKGVELEQGCGNLGIKMSSAADLVVASDRIAILLGADCPFVTPRHVQQLVESCTEVDCAVIGATDGGFVALATKVPLAGVFKGIDWGTERVLEQLIYNAKVQGCSLVVIDQLADIDRPEDLRLLDSISGPLAEFSKIDAMQY